MSKKNLILRHRMIKYAIHICYDTLEKGLVIVKSGTNTKSESFCERWRNMIEVIYNENQEDKSNGKTSLRLPKNIRQIGNTEEDFKIYIEDYVVTYLNQLTEKDLSKIRVAILMGDAVERDARYLFISGAIYVEDIVVDADGIHFTDNIWSRIYENIKEYFDTLEIVGWYLSVPGFPIEMNESIQKVHINHFAGNMKILMMHEPIEKDECFFRCENGVMKTIQGYYIYYEKNNLMQTYMIDHRNEKEETVIEEKTDEATKHFRSLVQEKQEEMHKRKTMAFMYSVSSVLVMIVLVIGITMLNNYDKMSNMEKSLAILTKNSITREADEKRQETSVEEDTQQAVRDDSKEEVSVSVGNGKLHTVAVETVSGNVEPLPAEAKEEVIAEEPKVAEESEVAEEPEVTEEPEITEPPVATQAPQEEVQAVVEPQYYVIEKGDTMAKISLKIYNTKDMVSKICEINEIEDVDKIFVGQKILLP